MRTTSSKETQLHHSNEGGIGNKLPEKNSGGNFPRQMHIIAKSNEPIFYKQSKSKLHVPFLFEEELINLYFITRICYS